MPTGADLKHTKHLNPHDLPFHPLPESPPAVNVKLLHYGYLHTTRGIWLDDGWDKNTTRREHKRNLPLSLPIQGALLTLPNGDQYIWDLGWRIDSENLPQVFRGTIPFGTLDAKEDSVAQKLVWKQGLKRENFKGIILSHAHVDHYGALDLFDPTVPCYSGKGTLEWINGGDLRGGFNQFPSRYLEQGRKFVEVAKDGYETRPIASFDEAYDFLGDGSLWLVKTPGVSTSTLTSIDTSLIPYHTAQHCPGHLSLLAHTGTNDWVFLSGDAAHHQSLYLPIPPLPYSHDTDRRSIPSLFKMTPDATSLSCMQDFPDLAWHNFSAMTRMEMQENLMVVLAHEIELGVVAELDQGQGLSLDDWRHKGWKEKKDSEGQRRRDELDAL